MRSVIAIFVVCASIGSAAWSADAPQGKLPTPEAVKQAPCEAITDGGAVSPDLRLDRVWNGTFCSTKLTNTGKDSVRVKEAVLFRVQHGLPPETRFYGEGFTMLSQTGGTLGQPVDIGGLTDRAHYKIDHWKNFKYNFGPRPKPSANGATVNVFNGPTSGKNA